MAHGSTVGLWLASGAIGLFLLVLALVVLRTAALYGSLVLTSLLGRGRGGDERAASAHDTASPIEPTTADGRAATPAD